MDTPKLNYHVTLSTEQGEVVQMWDLKDDIGDVSQSLPKQLLQAEICHAIEVYEKKVVQFMIKELNEVRAELKDKGEIK